MDDELSEYGDRPPGYARLDDHLGGELRVLLTLLGYVLSDLPAELPETAELRHVADILDAVADDVLDDLERLYKYEDEAGY